MNAICMDQPIASDPRFELSDNYNERFSTEELMNAIRAMKILA